MTRPCRRTTGERGAAVVDFVLVSVLVLALFLVVLQLGLVLHVRNVLVSSAQEGARHAANADVDVAEGRGVALDAVASALSTQIADSAADSPPSVLVPLDGGLTAVEVTLDADVPLVLPIAAIHLRVKGHAVREGG